MDWVNLPLVQLGCLGALVTVIVSVGAAVYTGKLIPKTLHDAMLAESDKAIDRLALEREEWKEAYHKSEAKAALKDEQIGELLETARTMNAVMNAVRELSQ